MGWGDIIRALNNNPSETLNALITRLYTALNTAIASKASQTSVDAVSSTLSSKASQSSVDGVSAALNSKAEQSAVVDITTKFGQSTDAASATSSTAFGLMKYAASSGELTKNVFYQSLVTEVILQGANSRLGNDISLLNEVWTNYPQAQRTLLNFLTGGTESWGKTLTANTALRDFLHEKMIQNPIMTALNKPSGTVASTPPANVAWNAFDNSLTSSAQVVGGLAYNVYYAFPYGTMIVPCSLSLKINDTLATAEWFFEASVGGLAWDTLSKRIGSMPNSEQWHNIKQNNEEAYTMFRIRRTAGTDAVNPLVYNVRFYGIQIA